MGLTFPEPDDHFPAFLQSFTHDPVHRLIWRDAALTAVFAVVIFALSVFALDHYQLISLAQLEAWQWLADIAARIGAVLGRIEFSGVEFSGGEFSGGECGTQLRTAAMARLV